MQTITARGCQIEGWGDVAGVRVVGVCVCVCGVVVVVVVVGMDPVYSNPTAAKYEGILQPPH